MSAQKPRRSGVLGAALGMVGFSVLAGVLVTVMVTPAVAVTGVTATASINVFQDLPNFIEIGQQNSRNTIFANQGGQPVPIATVYSENRQEVGWDDVSQYAKDALVSGEDRRFYEHGGVDIASLVRAAISNVSSGGIQSGASTLTMQLVKNIYIQQALNIRDPDPKKQAEKQTKAIQEAQAQTLDRKLREMRLAIQLEKKYTKDQILLGYLNIAGFGGNTYGIEAAAEEYYGTTAKNLTIAQAASLIAIVQEPTARNLADPSHYAANKERRDQILKRMLEDQKITKQQYDEAIATPVDQTTVHYTKPTSGCLYANGYAKFWCDYVVSKVPDLTMLGSTPQERKDNWQRGGYDIYTSLDLDMQQVAQDSVQKWAPANETRLNLGSATTSVEVGTGWIITMAENKNFDNTGQPPDNTYTAVNFNTDYAYGGSSGFQPGSTMKPFTLLDWLKTGHGLNEVVDATPQPHKLSEFTTCDGNLGSNTWLSKNDSGERGPYTVMRATVNSVNNAYIQMALQLNLCDISNIMESFGLHSANGAKIQRQNPAFILGSSADTIAPLTMAAAYAGIANNGVFCKPIAVTKVVDVNGKDLGGETPSCSPTLVDPATAQAAIYNLKMNLIHYGDQPSNGVEGFGKTGSTDSYVQTWVMGVTSKVATALWYGNISGQVPLTRYSIRGQAMSQARHQAIRPIINAIAAKYGGDPFPAPDPRFLTGSAAPTIPSDIVGLSPDGARSLLQGLDLRYVDGGPVDSDLPAGTVASTNPGPGTRVAKGTQITVYTSNGSGATVPNVVGQPLGAAVQQLQGAGFSNVACVPGNADQRGQPSTVVSTNPAVGSSTSRSTQVQVQMSGACS